MDQFDNVSIKTTANVYFDGKCISHTVMFSDGSRKTLGVIFPSKLTFNTEAPEIMELSKGKCRVKIKGDAEWREYHASQSFSIPGNTSFEIETEEMLDYICHFAEK